MPFHSNFNFQKISPNTSNPKGIKVPINFKNLTKLKSNELSSIMKKLNASEKIEFRYANLLSGRKQFDTTFGEFLPGDVAGKIIKNLIPLANESTVFKVAKSDLEALLSTVTDKENYRLIVKFGCESETTGLTLFLTAMKVRKKGEPITQIKDYIECVDVKSNALTTKKVIDGNFDTKTKNYFELRANKEDKRRGIAHFIQSVNNKLLEEVGIEDFIKSQNIDEYIYLHLGRGDVKLGKKKYSTEKDYLTIIFSHYGSINGYSSVTADANIFYDKSGTCCPPEY